MSVSEASPSETVKVSTLTVSEGGAFLLKQGFENLDFSERQDAPGLQALLEKHGTEFDVQMRRAGASQIISAS